MKILYFVVVSILFSFTTPKAQTIQSSGSAKIVYIYPHDGDDFVLEKATLIIRLSRQFMAHHTASDFSFTVTGEKSGIHAGKIIISDDNQTVIFKPILPYSLNEKVYVTFAIKNNASFLPLNYSFTITSMSEIDRGKALNDLHEKWRAEEQSVVDESPEGVPHPKGTDTIAFAPAVVVIDTILNHEEGNIFLSPTGSVNAKFSFLAITSDTASKAPCDSCNSFLFFDTATKSVGCGNFRMQPNGTLTFFQQTGSPKGGIFDGFVVHLNQSMRPIDTFQCDNGFVTDLHDFQLLDNGHAIMLAFGPRRVSMKQYFLDKQTPADTLLAAKTSIKQFLFNKQTAVDSIAARKATDSTTAFDAIIQELDQSKNVIFQWNSKDYFQFTDAVGPEANLTIKVGASDTLLDYMHINTADLDSDKTIIASFRHCDEVSKISRTDGHFIWRLGGKHNQFTFTGTLSPNDTIPFSHQHDPERIANGHMTIFDNGNLHTKDTTINGIDTIVSRPFTRALEYDLDEANHVANVVWEYDSLPYCLAAGNVQRLDNGNTLIGLGIVTQPSTIEVTPNGDKVFQMSIQKGAFSYRTYRYPFTPPLAVQQIGNANIFSLASIYPNPAQSRTTISFSVAAPGLMQIELLDILGHTVRNVSQRLPNAGSYAADLNVNNLPSGTYYCKLYQNGNEVVKMLVVNK